MPCDNATQSRTPEQSYCDCLSSSSDPRVLRCTYCYPSIYSAPPVKSFTELRRWANMARAYADALAPVLKS